LAETNKIIASISISGEITLNLHSLNNEGGEGNQIITRQVTIVDKAGENILLMQSLEIISIFMPFI
jgi:CRISPR-associated protein Cst2